MGVLYPSCKTMNTGDTPFCVDCGAELDLAGRIEELEDQLSEKELCIKRLKGKNSTKLGANYRWKWTLPNMGMALIVFGLMFLLFGGLGIYESQKQFGFVSNLLILVITVPVLVLLGIGTIIVLIARWRTNLKKRK